MKIWKILDLNMICLLGRSDAQTPIHSKPNIYLLFMMLMMMVVLMSIMLLMLLMCLMMLVMRMFLFLLR